MSCLTSVTATPVILNSVRSPSPQEVINATCSNTDPCSRWSLAGGTDTMKYESVGLTDSCEILPGKKNSNYVNVMIMFDRLR